MKDSRKCCEMERPSVERSSWESEASEREPGEIVDDGEIGAGKKANKETHFYKKSHKRNHRSRSKVALSSEENNSYTEANETEKSTSRSASRRKKVKSFPSHKSSESPSLSARERSRRKTLPKSKIESAIKKLNYRSLLEFSIALSKECRDSKTLSRLLGRSSQKKTFWTDRSSANEQKGNVLFVKNIPRDVKQFELEKCFRRFGGLNSVVVIRDPVTKISRGFAFVTFFKASSAKKMLAAANSLFIHRCRLMVTYARQKRTVSPRNRLGRSLNVFSRKKSDSPCSGTSCSPYPNADKDYDELYQDYADSKMSQIKKRFD